MDACFGLTRKKRQGTTSFALPKHGTLMFADQDDVDNYEQSYSEKANDVSKVHTCELIDKYSILKIFFTVISTIIMFKFCYIM